MRVYNLADRNYVVHAVNEDRVVYDVVFKTLDARDIQMLSDLGLPADTRRNTAKAQVLPTKDFAVRLAMGGHYLKGDTTAARKVIYAALTDMGYRLG